VSAFDVILEGPLGYAPEVAEYAAAEWLRLQVEIAAVRAPFADRISELKAALVAAQSDEAAAVAGLVADLDATTELLKRYALVVHEATAIAKQKFAGGVEVRVTPAGTGSFAIADQSTALVWARSNCPQVIRTVQDVLPSALRAAVEGRTPLGDIPGCTFTPGVAKATVKLGHDRSIPGSARIEKEVCEESEAGYCWVLVCPACDLESCHYESEVLGLLEVARHNRFNHPPQGTEPPEVTA